MYRRTLFVLLVAIPLVVWGLACDTSIHPPLGDADGGLSPGCLEADAHSDFAWVAANVFQPHCSAFSVCHSGSNPAGHMNLTPALAFSALVNVDAAGVSGWKRVVPGDPSRSYVMVKLGEVDGPLGEEGTTMPPNSPLLCAGKRAAVRRWIASGAGAGAAAAKD